MTQVNVSITKGYYRNKLISGTYRLVKGYTQGSRGGFITVYNPNPEPNAGPTQRITIEPGDYQLLDTDGNTIADGTVIENITHAAGSTTYATAPVAMNYATQFMNSETEAEAMERIATSFGMLDKITDAAAEGIIRGLVVSGPPGVGKSFGVKRQLEIANEFRVLGGQEPLFEIISGGISPVGLYQKLYYNRKPKQVLVFDDCDEVLEDSEMLTLMKAALNSGDTRKICWNKESRVLLSSDIPNSFDFEGSVLFLSNKDFDRELARNSRIAAHLAAIMSRCHVLNLDMNDRDCLLRVKQIVRDGMLSTYSFSAEDEASIVSFVMDNSVHLQEVSLRMVKKIADLVKAYPNMWLSMAETLCFTKESKYKRLLEKKNNEEVTA